MECSDDPQLKCIKYKEKHVKSTELKQLYNFLK